MSVRETGGCWRKGRNRIEEGGAGKRSKKKITLAHFVDHGVPRHTEPTYPPLPRLPLLNPPHCTHKHTHRHIHAPGTDIRMHARVSAQIPCRLLARVHVLLYSLSSCYYTHLLLIERSPSSELLASVAPNIPPPSPAQC